MDLQKIVVEWNEKKWEDKNKGMYKETDGHNCWPWYFDGLDPDVNEYLFRTGVTKGRILDLGTCSGGQAIALAKKGFDVVGTDISETALLKANAAAKSQELSGTLSFVKDDILNTKLEENSFDYVFDRGCFHCICYFGLEEYIQAIKKILVPGGKLILKVMSAEEDRFRDFNKFGDVKVPMPEHFDDALINKAFKKYFDIELIVPSFFYSQSVNPPAKARLATMVVR